MDNNNVGGFILAAGEGRRMRPASLLRPKALFPFCGVPLLELTASYLNSLNLGGLVVNACYQGERVLEYCRRLNGRNGWNIQVSLEDKLLNHGGGLRKGIKLLPGVEHFLVHNVDIIIDYDLQRLIDEHISSGADVTALLVRSLHAKHGVVLDDGGNVKHFRDFVHGTYAFSGIHIFRREVLDKYLPADEEAPDVIECYHKAIADERIVRGVVVPSEVFWSDIGTPQEYIRSHGVIADCALQYHDQLRQAQTAQAQRRFDLESRGVICTGALGLGECLGVPEGTQLHNAVLWDYTKLPKSLLYADGIFCGDDVRPPKPVNAARRPDPRILDYLGVDEADLDLLPLPKQGSGRNYCRIPLKDGRTVIWNAYNPERRENAGFAAISDFLSRLGIRVPKVLLHLPDVFELVTEDLGQNDMQQSGPLMETYLMQAVEQVARLHVIGDQAVRLEELPLQRGFTKGLYDWERNYFRENMLERCLQAPELWAHAAEEYIYLRTMLLKQPLVPIHRDLQSANIKVRDEKVWLIDFQGMRLGAAAYDLASLLYDPYQCHPAELRWRIWREYCAQVEALRGTPPADKLLPSAAIQRLMQALGAYGKLWLKDGMEWYRQFIGPALDMLVQAADEANLPGFRAMSIAAVVKWNSLNKTTK